MKKLIKSAKKGNSEAFGELYSLYGKDLYRFALYTLHDTFDAEDAVQNAALAAFRKIGDLKKEESFKSWFFKILYNECMKILGHKSRTFEVPSEGIAVFSEESYTYDETGIMALFDALPPREKSLITLSVFQEYNSVEIAEILGMTPSAVRSSLSRLFKKLRIQSEGENYV
ncbi:MAG: RNA polymerase sigma factor [Clostridia bacterium]|nr:RNA polymerase sigma factor [Clostridia bacterium]